MLSEINDSFGYTDLTLNDVDFYYGGLRPLVEDRGEAKSTYNTSRKTEILDHKESGFPGFFTAMGGKYTTSRSVGEAVVDKVADYLPGNFRACETSETPPSTGNCSDLLSLTKELGKKFPKLNGKSIETIAFRYGLQAYQILEKNFSKEEFYTLQNGENSLKAKFDSSQIEKTSVLRPIFSFADPAWGFRVYRKKKKRPNSFVLWQNI